jgi:hypothetical protein
MYENSRIKVIENYKMKKNEGIAKSNRGGELAQTTIYVCMENHSETFLHQYTLIKKKRKRKKIYL